MTVPGKKSHLIGLFGWLVCLALAAEVDGYGNIAGNWHVKIVDDSEFLYVPNRHQLNILLYFSDVDLSGDLEFYFEVQFEDPKKAFVRDKINKYWFIYTNNSEPFSALLVPRKVGYSKMFVDLQAANGERERSQEHKTVVVYQEDFVYDTITTYTAFVLTLMMMVNAGSVLDKNRATEFVYRPWELFVSFLGRFIVTPLLALLIGWLCFPHDNYLKIALLFTAIAPSGGFVITSIILLKANLNLSVSTVVVNFLLTLAMWPIWIYLVASHLFKDDSLLVPYERLAVEVGVVIGAVCCGLFLRLKASYYFYGFLFLYIFWGLVLIGYILISLNFFFDEVTYQICLASFGLPLSGFLATWLLAKVFYCSDINCFTNGVTSGLVNITLPITLLRANVEGPKSDLVCVVPIMCGFGSICWALVFYFIRRFSKCCSKQMEDTDSFDFRKLRR